MDRQDSALVLNAQLKLELGPAVEDALVKGLAVHFVADAELMRDRWYWYDRKLGGVSRYYRLAFQPLTRRWRLNVSSEPISNSGLSSTISQNFETLSEALGVIRRQSGWKVANASDLDADGHQYLLYRFKLDFSQLPRPFQIAAGNQADWNLVISRSFRQNLWATKTSRWLVTLGAVAMVVIGLGLLVLLTQATGHLGRYNQNYEWLVLVNRIVAGGLLLTILWGFVRLILRWRSGQFGAKLLLKLAAIFALVGVVPGVLIYVVSYQFVSRSIESWFDVKVEAALVGGLNLGRATLDTLSNDLGKQTRAAASQLADVMDTNVGMSLDKLQEQNGYSDVVLWNVNGKLVASAGQSRFQIRPERPPVSMIKEARQKGAAEWIEGLDESSSGADKGRIKVLVLVPQSGMAFDEDRKLLQITQDLPTALVNNALEVQSAYREYQERALAREGLRRMYIGTLTLSLFLAVLGAILLAVLLGNQLARPLLLLAHGMRQVAAGDLTPKMA
eukprot:gene27436-34150_t